MKNSSSNGNGLSTAGEELESLLRQIEVKLSKDPEYSAEILSDLDLAVDLVKRLERGTVVIPSSQLERMRETYARCISSFKTSFSLVQSETRSLGVARAAGRAYEATGSRVVPDTL